MKAKLITCPFCEVAKYIAGLAVLFLVWLFGLLCGVAYKEAHPAVTVQDLLPTITVSLKDPIGDLQRFFNGQGDRYSCGEPDSVPGPLFRQASKNWICDQYAKPYFKEKQ